MINIIEESTIFMAVLALASLLETIELISNSSEALFESLVEQLELNNLKEIVTFTYNILSHLGKKFNDGSLDIERLKFEVCNIRIIASEVEYKFQALISHMNNQQDNSLFVKKIAEEFDSLNTYLLWSYEPKLLYNNEQSSADKIFTVRSLMPIPEDHEINCIHHILPIRLTKSASLDDVIMVDEVVDFLLTKSSSSSKLEVIAMGGIGGRIDKEAFAKLIYDDSRIRDEFECCGWFSVESEESDDEERSSMQLPYLKVLDQFWRRKGKPREEQSIKESRMKKILQNWSLRMEDLRPKRISIEEKRLSREKRYLVIIHNLQDRTTWKEIKSLFPDGEGGILLIMITQILGQIVGPTDEIRLHGSLLVEEMRTIHNLIFGDSSSREFEMIFQEIFRSCDDIPTSAVIMVATYLSSIHNSYDSCLKVQQCLVNTLPKFKDKIIGTATALLEVSKDIDSIDRSSTSAAHNDDHLKLETKTQEITKRHDYFLSVGLGESLKELLLELTESSQKLKKLGIVGMAGIGKTTIAKMIFEEHIVIQHFDCRAWIKVSQTYRRIDLLVELLQCIKQQRYDDLRGKSEYDLEENIWRSLKGLRYLIVVDDLWSVGDWNGIRRLFPDDNRQSRILFTSRQSNVIEHIKCEKIHHMSLLDEKTSWDLMQKRVFGEDTCPTDLEDIGKQIAKRCQGLPLVIVVIAGVLLNKKTLEGWKAVADSISSIVMSSENPCEEMLALSYNHLPCYLKSCYLYMGAFRGGGLEIESQSLVRLWIAEGFIIQRDLESLEQTAEDYLKDLIERSLVLTSRKKYNGKVKTCRLHDLLLEFCIDQSRKENFFDVVKDSRGREEEENDDEEQEEDPGKHLSNGKNNVPCRFSFHCDSFENIPPKPQVVSALFTESSREVPDILLYNLDFKSLIVLDMIPLRFDSFPVEQVSKLFLLKYLALTASFELPDILFRLQKLQTLIINDSRIISDTTPALALPREFWRSKNLRHLQLQVANYLPPPDDLSDICLKYLQTLSEVTLGSCTPETFACIPNVIKLIVRESIEDFQVDSLWNQFFENLVGLSGLQKLNLNCLQMNNSRIRQLPIPTENAFPQTLNKLTLGRSNLPWEKMKILGELPNLVVLKLRNYAFQGPEWEKQEGGFENLEFLLIENTDLQIWKLEYDDCFPRLKRLILKYCHLLAEIPEEIADSPLTYIELRYCSDSSAQSAKYIQEQQLEEYCNNIEVRIQTKLGINQSKSVKEREE